MSSASKKINKIKQSGESNGEMSRSYFTSKSKGINIKLRNIGYFALWQYFCDSNADFLPKSYSFNVKKSLP